MLILMRRAHTDVDLGGVHIQPGTEVRDCSSAEALRKQEALYFGPAAELSIGPL